MHRTLPMRLAPALIAAMAAAACERGADLPTADSEDYATTVAAFHRGIAAAQIGESAVAEAAFRQVTELAPDEPAGWANYGVVALQRSELETAASRLREARARAPENAAIHVASAVAARERGDLAAAAEHLRQAIHREPDDPRARYLLAEILEQEGRASGIAEALEIVEQLAAGQPSNVAAQVERGRLAARAGEREAVLEALDALEAHAQGLPPGVRARLEGIRAVARDGDLAAAATELVFLQTELQELPAYRADRAALVPSVSRAELLLTSFLRLPPPTSRPAPADTALAFSTEALEIGPGAHEWVRSVFVDELSPLAIVGAAPGSLRVGADPERTLVLDLPEPGGVPLPPAGVTVLDYDYDFRADLLVAGPGGLRLLRQEDGGFVDAPSDAIPRAVSRLAYAGAWAADLDMEGDMDVVLAPVDGPATILVNLGNGRFEAAPGLDVRGLRAFEWADLDGDGDPDAATIDSAGRLRVFMNRRHETPRFVEQTAPAGAGEGGPYQALAAAELTGDATFDLLLLDEDGTLRFLTLDGPAIERRDVGQWPRFAPGDVADAALFVHDLDNNGRLDIIASSRAGSRLWLGTDDGFRDHGPIPLRVTDVADLSGEARLDLLGVTPDGDARWIATRGEHDYFGTLIRPRAATATGDRRINSFGIGGEIELRAGLLYQKRRIEGPVVHVGLGEHQQVDVARIIWPNGTVQAEFNLDTSNEAALTRQRLKGSCPWIFAYDGREMAWVTDFLWRTALGLRINAQGETAVLHAEDWVLIRGDELRPRDDGLYDIRITAELWETHFFDHVALMVVDHPAGTEVLVDERFTLPAPEPAVHTVSALRRIAAARDHRGRDVTSLVSDLDAVYLDTFRRGPYQGVAEEHYIEVDLGDGAAGAGGLWLVASGWIYPTDSSINLARAQGGLAAPRGLRLEVPDGQGGWVVAVEDLGFPAGRSKTMLIDLTEAFRPGTARRLRLHTDMEIYWDRLAWVRSATEAEVRTRRLLPTTAELRYRGFSEVEDMGRTAPERPAYAVASTARRWRDLEGYYTRYGDVRPLSEAVDDRYVIMNAGDELVLRFPAPPAPPEGWTRDFVLIGDGWIKDGDYNTGFSQTVLPLPYHGLADYDAAPGRLEEDPGYRRHPEDWKVFHTRYVTPQEFHDALLPRLDD